MVLINGIGTIEGTTPKQELSYCGVTAKTITVPLDGFKVSQSQVNIKSSSQTTRDKIWRVGLNWPE